MSDHLPPGFVSNREIGASGNNPITADKLEHLHQHSLNFGLVIGDTPTNKEQILFVAEHAGQLLDCGAGLYDSGTSTSIAFDILKNGVSMLASAITVVHGTGDRTEVAGSISGPGTFVAGDVITGKCTVTSSTGAQGPWLRAAWQHNGD